jgi:hypothetical protein
MYANQDGPFEETKRQKKEVPMLFYKNRICMNQMGLDKFQFAHVTIDAKDLVDYEPNLENARDKGSNAIFSGVEEDFKGIILDLKVTLQDLMNFAAKDSLLEMRVNTVNGRIEFHMPENIVIWTWALGKSQDDFSEKLPYTIKKVRSTVRATLIKLEPLIFSKICNLGGGVKLMWAGNKWVARSEDERIFISADTKEGLVITSGDREIGRFLDIDGAENEFNPEMIEQMYKDAEEGNMPKGVKDKVSDMIVDPSSTLIYIKQEYITPFLKIKGLSTILLEIRNDKPLVIEQFPYSGVHVILTVALRVEFEEE